MGLDKIEKLRGRDNYDTWKFAAKSYLVLKGYWPCIEGVETDASKNLQAISAIGLLLEPTNYSYVQECSSAKDAWLALQKAYEDNGVLRRMDLLKYFIRLEYNDCNSMEDYVNKMTTTKQKLNKSGTQISDEICAQIILSGLPEEYRPMVMAIANCGKQLSTDLVCTNLLQEVTHEPKEVALFTKKKNRAQHNKPNKNKKTYIVCFECSKTGHYANRCPNKNSDKVLFASASFFTKTNSEMDWFVDSGSTAHMTRSKENLNATHVPKNQVKEVIVGDSNRLNVECAGDTTIQLSPEESQNNHKIDLNDVLYVPELCTNLLSVSQLAKKGNTIIFNSKNCRIFDQNNKLSCVAPLTNGLYKINAASQQSVSSFTAVTDKTIWHRRLGHPCEYNMNRIKTAVDGVNFTNKKIDKCIPCVMGKQTRASYEKSDTRATKCLELIHTDLCGPMSKKSLGGARFLLTFIDDFSRKVFVYALKSKNDVFDTFVSFKNFVENQMDTKIKKIRSDNGREYCNNKFISFTSQHGILHQLTAPYTPEQNGVAERMNRSIIEKTRCMLFDANLPTQYWAEATNTAAYLINRTPCREMENITPEEIWSKKKPDLNILKIFGCKAMVQVPDQQRRKLEPKSVECIFLGYSETSKAYKLFNPKSRKIIISKNVVFFEDSAGKVDKSTTFNFNIASSKTAKQSFDPITDDEDTDSEDDNFNIFAADTEVKSDAVDHIVTNEFDLSEGHYIDTNNPTSETNFGLSEGNDEAEIGNPLSDSFVDVEYEVRMGEAIAVNMPSIDENCKENKEHIGLLSVLADPSEPLTVTEALNSDDKEKWSAAMKEEIAALHKNHTWELVDLPPGRKAINSKWVFKIKRSSTGEIDRFKARLVVKGYSQVKGIDYDETYSPVARYSSIRFLIALAAKYNLLIHQMDAVTAFLQGELKEEIFMQQPEEFSDGTKKVCRLLKSLYGLKQSSRVWNTKYTVLVERLGFNKSSVDQCIYVKHSEKNTIILAIYVDDLLIFGSNAPMITKLKKKLSEFFNMKDMGNVSTVLGMNITRNDDSSISIDQRGYILRILQRFNMTDCNPANTPLDPNQQLSKDMCPQTNEEKEEMQNIPYQEAIGSILYAAQISRPDISFAVSSLSRYNNNFGKTHWQAMKRVLRYLKGTIDFKLTYAGNGNGELIGYCDADWAGDRDERRSTTGYVFNFQGGAISWATRKQPTIALSSTEAEFMSMVAAIQEALWLKRFERDIVINSPEFIEIFCDNQGAIQLALNNNYQARTKHIEVKNYFIREKLQEGIIKLKYLCTNDMIADILTKAVNHIKLKQFVQKFGLNE